MGLTTAVILISAFLLILFSRSCTAVSTAENSLKEATDLLEEWHKFRHNINRPKLNSSKYPKPGSNCTETLNETLAILLYDRLEVSQTYFPHRDFKTQSHVAHHLSFYKEKMPAPGPTQLMTDFCKSTIPQDFHRYTVDKETGFSIPFRPFHVVCNASKKCTHCMEVQKKEEPDLYKACHDYELQRPEAEFKEAYPLHFAMKQWFRGARMSPPKVHNDGDPCTASLEQNLEIVKLWAMLAKKTGQDPSDYEEFEKEWTIVEGLATKLEEFERVNKTFKQDLVGNWKNVKWCKPRGGKDVHGLVCWHEKCERCRNENKMRDPLVNEICSIQTHQVYEDEDVDVQSGSSRRGGSGVFRIVGITCLANFFMYFVNMRMI